MQERIYRTTRRERRRSLCSLCFGHRRLCGRPVCPLVVKAKAVLRLEPKLSSRDVFGASPPAVFVGSWGYPRVLAGPLVPPIPHVDTSTMDMPERWVDMTMEEVLQKRLSLVRGKSPIDVRKARNPDRILSAIQNVVMASRPVDTEMRLRKRPRITLTLNPREPMFGPSAPIDRVSLAENPAIPRKVDAVVSDTDLKAEWGILELYTAGVPQRQIMRMLSIGLLGVKKQRRLIPTEWSITATDDIISRALHRKILEYKEINEFMLFGHEALGNNVQILLMPTPWMFEALETWLTTRNPPIASDYELTRGRKDYAGNVAGAYYAVRLPILEYLSRIRRQAGAIAFLEVYPTWIPTGVWRFREIARKALQKQPTKHNTLEEALKQLSKKLKMPIQKWIEKSEIIKIYRTQKQITTYMKRFPKQL